MRAIPAALLVAALSACGTTTAGRGVVIPYQDGRLVAQASARSEEDALRDALAAAKDECQARRAPLAVVKQKTEYQGVVAREVVKTAEQLEKIIAEGAEAVIPDLSSDEDYKVSIEFRCGG
jgi:class 3 adenylate cyclase